MLTIAIVGFSPVYCIEKFRAKRCNDNLLRWYDTLKYGDSHEKFNFMKIEDLRPLNTCQKHFQTILPNFPLDECEI